MVALAFTDGFLYAATSNRELLRRESLEAQAAWITFDADTPSILAMGAVGDKLYATISVFDATALVVRSATAAAPWEAIGVNNATGIIAIAGGLGSAIDVTAMTGAVLSEHSGRYSRSPKMACSGV